MASKQAERQFDKGRERRRRVKASRVRKLFDSVVLADLFDQGQGLVRAEPEPPEGTSGT